MLRFSSYYLMVRQQAGMRKEQSMQAQAIGLKKRIAVVVAATLVATTMVASPAQAANKLGRTCERISNNQNRQLQCCKNRASNNAELRKCRHFVRNH